MAIPLIWLPPPPFLRRKAVTLSETSLTTLICQCIILCLLIILIICSLSFADQSIILKRFKWIVHSLMSAKLPYLSIAFFFLLLFWCLFYPFADDPQHRLCKGCHNTETRWCEHLNSGCQFGRSQDNETSTVVPCRSWASVCCHYR